MVNGKRTDSEDVLPVVLVVKEYADGHKVLVDNWAGKLPTVQRMEALAYAEKAYKQGGVAACHVVAGKMLAKWGPGDGHHDEPSDCAGCGRVLDPVHGGCPTCMEQGT